MPPGSFVPPTDAGEESSHRLGGLHPLLAGRWSPTTFDPTHELAETDADLLLEAARWAPSAGNSQPWAFVVGCRGDAVHRRLVGALTASTARWAPAASALVANLCHRYVEGTDWAYSEFAHYDLGQAVAHLTVQAQALGLSVHQFRAFDRARLSTALDVPPHWEVTTMAAIGTPVSASTDPMTLPATGRTRRPLEQLRWRAVPPSRDAPP